MGSIQRFRRGGDPGEAVAIEVAGRGRSLGSEDGREAQWSFSTILKGAGVTAANSEYKDCIISVEVSGPDALGAYVGTFVITHKEGDVQDDRQFMPTWQKPAFSEAEAFAALTQLAKDIIDGAKQDDRIENG